ncbi:hypothetical protein D3C85_1882550 [compost metagenome]
MIASLIIVPSDAAGDCTPKPRKLRNASAKMALGTVSVSVTIIGPMALGIRCRNKIRAVLAPSACAAITYS